ncbi:MAG: hypothetical protein ABF254_05895 [Octadecabacter sp.]
MTEQSMTAWMKIPVTDLDASHIFYDAAFGWTWQVVSEMGQI